MATERNGTAIEEATLSGENAVRYMMQRLVIAGATPNELLAAIDHLVHEARTAATLSLSQREGKSKAAGV